MLITIAICTHNRAALLRETLFTLTEMVPAPGSTWELLVVNNGCTDDTSAVLREFSCNLPLRVFYEATLGLSNARNCAVAAASGEYIIWTDDDVRVSPKWMHEYVSAFRQHPRAWFFGGPIEPIFELVPPAWLLEVLPQVRNVFAARELGDEGFQINGHPLPFGANLAVRTTCQRQFLYNPQLGQQAGQLMVGEETEMLCAMLQKGGTGWWVPGARVKHFIPRNRQHWKYLQEYWYASGKYQGLRLHASGSVNLRAYQGSLRKLVLQRELAYRLRRFTRSRVRLVHDLRILCMTWGAYSSVTTQRQDYGANKMKVLERLEKEIGKLE